MVYQSITLLRNVCVAASIFSITDAAFAGAVTSGASILEHATYAINSATSSLAYNPGTFSFGTDGSGGSSTTVNYIIGGSFDVTSWTIDDGNTKWLTISNVNLTADSLPKDFQMPDFINSQLIGSVFSGNGDLCSNVPAGSIAACFSNGEPSPSITGQLQNSAIHFDAFVPVGSAAFGGGSNYQINAAAVVPIPAAFWLFMSAMGFYGFSFWQKSVALRKS